MRPKKKILLIDESGRRRNLWSFLLYTKGFNVLEAGGIAEALEIAAGARIDLFVVEYRGGIESQLPGLKENHPDTRLLLVSEGYERCPVDTIADGFIGKAEPTSNFVQTVRILICHKRGPKGMRAPQCSIAI